MKMKKVIYILSLLALATACTNKELCREPHTPGKPGNNGGNTLDISVVINWASGVEKPTQGMRINLFCHNNFPHYGVDDVDVNGCSLQLEEGSSHMGYCYNYYGNNIYFRNEADNHQIEAYCPAQARSTYSRAFPDEVTVSEPDGLFFIDKVDRFDVDPEATPLVMHFYPQNVMKTYTFEIRNIRGIRNITDTRGGISGMSNSYFLSSNSLGTNPTSVLFKAKTEVATNRIVGSFRTFGRMGEDNHFTIEILYPSSTGGIAQFSWNVTDQIDDGINYHIIIDGSEIDIPKETGSTGGGFEADVNEWQNETIYL